jgi:hypothetical protein
VNSNKKKDALVLIIPNNIWNEIKNIIPSKISNVGRPQNDPHLVLRGRLIRVQSSLHECKIALQGIKVSYVLNQDRSLTAFHTYGTFYICMNI